MDITITINTDNAAFEDVPEHEVGRILREFAQRLYDGGAPLSAGDEFNLRDINGNTVGKVVVK